MIGHDIMEQLTGPAGGIVTVGANLLLQSTLLITVGLSVAAAARRRGPAFQSVVLRTTLAAVVLCPLAAWTLGVIGIERAMIAIPSVPSRALSVAAERQSAPIVGEDSPVRVEPSSRAQTTTGAVSRGENAVTARADASDVSKAVRVPAEVPSSLTPESEGSQRSGEPDLLAARISETEDAAAVSMPSAPGEEAAVSGAEPASRLALTYVALAAGWVLIGGGLLLRLILCVVRLSRLRRSSRPAEPAVIAECRAAAEALGTRCPPVRVSPFISSPCLTGLLRPMILLPESDHEEPKTRRQLFLHELAHLQRRDCFWHLLCRVSTTVLCFQPLAWVLSRRIEQASDEVCDDYVVQHGSDRASYARQLVIIAERFVQGAPEVVVGAGMIAFRSSLSRRVGRIMDRSRTLHVRIGGGSLAAIAILSTLGIYAASLIGVGHANAAGGSSPTPDDMWPETPIPAPTASRPAEDPPAATTQPAAATAAEAQAFATAVSGVVQRMMDAQPPAFLTPEDRARLVAGFGDFVRKHPPAAMSGERRQAILDAFARHAQGSLVKGDYLYYDDQVDTLRWKLWMASRRGDLSEKERKRLAEQREWMRALIQGLPEEQGFSRKHPTDMLEAAFNDPFCVFFDRPMTAEEWRRFQELVQENSACKHLAHVAHGLHESAWRAQYQQGGKLAIPLPEPDDLRGWGSGNTDFSLRFVSNEANPMSGGPMPDIEKRPRCVWSLSKDMTPVPENITSGQALDAWMTSKGETAIGYDDANGGGLFAIGDVKMARVEAADWLAVDRISDKALEVLVERYGQRVCMLRDLHEKGTEAGQAGAYVAVRDQQGRLAVLHARFDRHLPGMIYVSGRSRPLQKRKYFTVGAPAATPAVAKAAEPAPPSRSDPSTATTQPAKDDAEMRAFVERFSSLSPQDQHGTLSNECNHGSARHVAWILDQQPELVNQPLSDGEYPLSLAASSVQPEIVKLLLARGAHVKARDPRGGRTALHGAANYGSVEVGRILLEHGADVNARDEQYGITPLFVALNEDERPAMVRFLVEHGADVNAVAKFGDGITPLQMAIMEGFLDSARYLAEHGAKLDLLSAAGLGKLDELKQLAAKTAKPWEPNAAGLTALHTAALGGATEVISYLLAQGLDVNATAKVVQNMTPLTCAVKNGQAEAVAVLLKAGADPNRVGWQNMLPLALVFHSNVNSTVPLATRRRLLTLLLDHKADVRARDPQERTVLHEAAWNGDRESLRQLLEHGADVNAVSKQKRTPLHAAAGNCNLAAIELLLAAGANVNAQDAEGRTPLHRLADARMDRPTTQAVAMLLAHQANPNLQDRDGRTPLHRLAERDQAATITLLLAHGADPTIRDKQGNRPSDKAGKEASKAIASYHADAQRQREEQVRWAFIRLLESFADGSYPSRDHILFESGAGGWDLERWRKEVGGRGVSWPDLYRRWPNGFETYVEGGAAAVRLPSDKESATEYVFILFQRFGEQWRAVRMETSPADVNLATHVKNAGVIAPRPGDAR